VQAPGGGLVSQAQAGALYCQLIGRTVAQAPGGAPPAGHVVFWSKGPVPSINALAHVGLSLGGGYCISHWPTFGLGGRATGSVQVHDGRARGGEAVVNPMNNVPGLQVTKVEYLRRYMLANGAAAVTVVSAPGFWRIGTAGKAAWDQLRQEMTARNPTGLNVLR
jgi:hypothetical protein